MNVNRLKNIIQYNFAVEITFKNKLYKIIPRKMCVSNKRMILISN
jgi:hypothetical protein